MKVSSHYPISLPRQEIWQHLQDPQMLATILPGCTHLEQTAVNEFTGQITINTGPIKGNYKGTITLSNIKEATGYDLEINGAGDSSFVRGVGHLQLIEQDDGTAIAFDGEAHVGGRLAGVSDRLLTTAANSIMRRSLEALENQVMPQNGTTAVATTAVTPTPYTNGYHSDAIVETVASDSRRQFVLISLTVGLIGAVSTTTFFLILRQIYRWWVNRLTKRIIAELQQQKD